MTPETKLRALREALDGVIAPALKLNTEKLYLFAKGSPPVGRHLHAWCYPADAFLEGPSGSIAIAFKQDSLERMDLRHLIPILAHEAGHALVDIEKIREGKRIDESRAEGIGKEIMRTYGLALESIVRSAEEEIESGA